MRVFWLLLLLAGQTCWVYLYPNQIDLCFQHFFLWFLIWITKLVFFTSYFYVLLLLLGVIVLKLTKLQLLGSLFFVHFINKEILYIFSDSVFVIVILQWSNAKPCLSVLRFFFFGEGGGGCYSNSLWPIIEFYWGIVNMVSCCGAGQIELEGGSELQV